MQRKKRKEMKSIFRYMAIAALAVGTMIPAGAQMIKMNGPATLAGIPNIGYEHAFTPKFSVSADAFWLPYLTKKHEQVFRSFQAAAEARYYFKASLRDNDYLTDGWYIGAYLLFGNYNIGLYRHNDMDRSFRRRGWGGSAGISVGWKYEFNRHWQMDVNLGIGYAHLVYDKYKLGGMYANHPLSRFNHYNWVGPTRFSVSFGYVLDTHCRKK